MIGDRVEQQRRKEIPLACGNVHGMAVRVPEACDEFALKVCVVRGCGAEERYAGIGQNPQQMRVEVFRLGRKSLYLLGETRSASFPTSATRQHDVVEAEEDPRRRLGVVRPGSRRARIAALIVPSAPPFLGSGWEGVGKCCARVTPRSWRGDMRKLWICVLLAGFGGSARAATCFEGTAVPANGVKLEASAGGSVSRPIVNPFASDATVDGRTATVCWLTPEQTAGGTTCAAAQPRHPATAMFELEYCNGTARAPLYHGNTVPTPKANEYIITYTPITEEPHRDTAFLRFEFAKTENDVVMKQFVVNGETTPSFDPLYRLMTYLGTTASFSENDFGKNHPELRLLVESRLVDGYEKCLSEKTVDECGKRGQKRLPFPDYKNIRLYGDVGLTSTTVMTSGSEPTFESKRAFDGAAGIGVGGSYNRATRPGNKYTNRFSYSLVARAGQITVPGEDANVSGDHFHNHNVALRFENENGYFEGAYFETGMGRSDQFRQHPHKRWKSDGYLPFFRPGTVRMAVRVNVDIPAPWDDLGDVTKVRDEAGNVITDPKRARSLLRAGDVKISFLLSIDIKKVFGFAGAVVGD